MASDNMQPEWVSTDIRWPDWVSISSDWNDPGGVDPDEWTAVCGRDAQEHQGTLQACAEWAVGHFNDPQPEG
jgi:hypothetical protein